MSPAPRRQPGKQAYGNRYRGRKPSSTDWLQILDIDGPFLAAPVITDTWPAGLPALDPEPMNALRAQSVIYDNNVGARDGYIRHMLTSTLDWRTNLVWGPEAAHYAVTVPEHQTTVDITFAMLGQDDQGTIQPDKPLLLGAVIPPGTSTTGRAPTGTGSWPASPADRVAHAMRTREVPLGLVTNGTTWTMVTISAGGAVSTATWTRHGWLEEAETLRAFVAILDRKRFLGVGEKETLPGLLAASLARQEEVTERLSEQSQSVVEMLVATIGRADAHHKAETGQPLLPAEVKPAEVYQATVTILMRLVFLLYAEERGLLPLDDDTYATTYAVSTLAKDLRDRATEQGEDTLERTSVGWHRLLAVFRAVHRGVRHEQLLLPAYGGSLCDPDRYPWLEGRTSPDEPLGAQHVPAIDDRTLLRALDSLQTLQFTKERRQVSYRSLDVEQIGYVYEGLLDQDARRADDWVVSIAVSDRDLRKNGPELALTDLEAQHLKGEAALVTWLYEQTKKVGSARSKASILKALRPPIGDDLAQHARLIREASGNDDAATERLMPYCKLLRLDPRDLPVVYPPGSLYLTDSDARANTGAVYTPKFLAEQVVQGALEPLVYEPGPLDTEDKGAWKIKTPEQILALKVADIAAGSGAFLVAAARYLASKLIEARLVHTPAPQLDATTEPNADQAPPARLAVERAEQDELDARRSIIDHCIYGIDINPMAVEMAKLSLWLITLDRNRPFGFLDDRLAVGDSLLGVTHTDQISNLHLNPKAGRRLHKDTLDLFVADTDRLLKEAAEIRQQIAEIDLRDTRDADHKARLLEQARTVTNRVALVADGLSAASLEGGSDSQYLALTRKVADAEQGKDPDDRDLREYVTFRLTRPDGSQDRPAHFPLLFPEVFADGRSGFDAVVGNPPFLGGQKLTGTFGVPYREHLVRVLGRGARGSADLVAYMLLRAVDLLDRSHGQCGLIATNTLAQGDTREVGLDQVTADGLDIRAAVKSDKWPTEGANLEYAILWGSRRPRADGIRAVADGQLVSAISPSLDPAGRVTGNPHRLAANRGVAYIGNYVLGLDFTLTEDEARRLTVADPRNADVIFPYLIGDDLNSRPDCSASRWIINFHDWPLEKAEQYVLPMERVRRLVKPDRDKLTRVARKKYWWRYAEVAPGLYKAIKLLDRVITIALTSSVVQPVVQPTGQVFDQVVVVFASDDFALFATVASAVQYWWVVKHGATLETRLRYTPSDVFQTLPLPPLSSQLREAGESLHEARSALMLKLQLGLTKMYNFVNDPSCQDGEVGRLREHHVAVNQAVFEAYGWTDLDPGHGHYETRQGVRWTVAPPVQTEILDRLLELNHQRYAEEVSEGLHEKGAKRVSRKKADAVDELQTPFGGVPTLFGGVPTLFGKDS
jgi:hypothetical protein